MVPPRVLLMQSQCVPACPDIYPEMQTRALHALRGHWKISTKFNTWLSSRDKGTKLVQALLNPWSQWARTPAQRGVQEGSGGLHGSATAWKVLLDQITSLHCASVSISALRQATGKTFYSMFWDLQVTLYHNVAESMRAYHSFQLHTSYKLVLLRRLLIDKSRNRST